MTTTISNYYFNNYGTYTAEKTGNVFHAKNDGEYEIIKETPKAVLVKLVYEKEDKSKSFEKEVWIAKKLLNNNTDRS